MWKKTRTGWKSNGRRNDCISGSYSTLLVFNFGSTLAHSITLGVSTGYGNKCSGIGGVCGGRMTVVYFNSLALVGEDSNFESSYQNVVTSL